MLSDLKKKIHIFHNIYLKHKHFIKKKSYSMDGEDIFIVEYFRKKNNGFYIDVGCYHPIHRNNTFLLYKKGWKGMNIDIHNFSIELFKFLRPDDFNMGDEGIVDFDAGKHLRELGYDDGTYKVQYLFLRKTAGESKKDILLNEDGFIHVGKTATRKVNGKTKFFTDSSL